MTEDGSSESKYGSSYEEEEDEEEEEPKLKYQRVGASVFTILKDDKALKLVASLRYLVLVTISGFIYVLDFNGNEIRKFQQPASIIQDVSVDEAEENIATVSKDGKVFIYSLCNPEIQTFSYKNDLTCIAIDPMYNKKSTKQFLIGGENGRLIMHEKGWLGKKDNLIHSGEGPVYSIKWYGNLVAWSNDTGVKVYDCGTFHKISHVSRPKASKSSEVYDASYCKLIWKEDNYLLMAWGNNIKIGHVREKPKMEVAPGWPSRYMEIVSILECDYVACGIVPFFEDFAVLAFSKDSSKEVKTANRPEIRVIKYDGEELSNDALSIANFESLTAKNYQLECFIGENQFYILSPNELILCKPRDVDDHISWLLDRSRYEEAIDATEKGEAEKLLNFHTVSNVGQKYLDHLISQKNYSLAASICPRVLGQDKNLWEKWVFTFAELRKLNAVAPMVPVNSPQLSETVYEMILAYFLDTDPCQFRELVHSWPLDLYNVENITNLLEDYTEKLKLKIADDLSSPKKKHLDELMNSLAYLHEKNHQFDKALKYYLILKQDHVFDLINDNNLFDKIRGKVLLILQFHEPAELVTPLDWQQWRRSKSLQLLVNSTDRIPISQVVDQLKTNRKYLHIYLDALFEKDSHIASMYHYMQVELYADYDYSRLSEFLRASNEYPLEKALEMCQKRNLIPEMVFILGRMGNTKKALKLIINQLGDVTKAIEFAKEHNDDELWNELVVSSLDKPNFICGLLENIGIEINPVKIISRIPKNLPIPKLKQALMKVLSDYSLQMSLFAGCQCILNRDYITLLEKLHLEQTKGECFSANEARCETCDKPLKEKNALELVTFSCGHRYHSKCIDVMEKDKENSTTASSSSQTSYKKHKGVWSLVCPICQ